MTAAQKFQRLLEADPRFDAEAYNFVYEALDYTLKHIIRRPRSPNQHVSGAQLLDGIRRYCVEQFGCLARTVLESWGVRKTGDFGEIVFNLVRFDLMGKQESDRREDFESVYRFEEVFDLMPVFHYSREKDEWQATYLTSRQFARARHHSRVRS